MTAKKIIVKILTMLVITIAGGGMLTLLIAANQKQQAHLCRDVRITIKGDGDQFFIDKDDILFQLTSAAKGGLVSRPVAKINLASLENALEKALWIRDAELYFDSRDVLHVIVTERQPVARIFTRNGLSFYIDSTGHRMPLLEKETARVLVVSNFTGAAKYNAADSAMAADVNTIVRAISRNEFWKEQIGEVYITPAGKYEAIPVIGNHIIRFGSAENIEQKLAKLFVFYRRVLSKTGFDKYAAVDLQYDEQVVGILPGPVSAIDSIQLQKNIQELLERSKAQMLQDSLAQVAPQLSAVDTVRRQNMAADSLTSNAVRTVSSHPLQQSTGRIQQRPVTRDSPRSNQRVPRAVMPPGH